MEKNNTLNDDQLKEVSGGAVYLANGDSKRPWQAVDDKTGVALGSFATSKEAERAAWKNGQSQKEIKGSELKKLRA
ncbi:MAG: hypothetical protein K6G16_11865 [Lachnospiraceae bacterium]|nr:hypothetical protein [Lachnospiraceae bacterium]